MTKAYIFDFFGVLYGSGFRSIYNQLGGNVNDDYEYIKKHLNKTDSGHLSHSEFTKIVADKLNLTIEEYESALKSTEQPNFELFDYIVENLKPKYKLAIISNAGVGTLESKVAPELLNIFDSVTVSGEVGIMKPDPKIFEFTLDELGVEAKEAVFIDDLEGFVHAAESLGMNGIHYTTYQDFKDKVENLLN